MITIKNYFNELKIKFEETTTGFKELPNSKKVITVALTIFAGIPTFGIASFPVMRQLVKKFKLLNSSNVSDAALFKNHKKKELPIPPPPKFSPFPRKKNNS